MDESEKALGRLEQHQAEEMSKSEGFASAVVQMDDDTLARHVHSSEIDELDRAIAVDEQRRRENVRRAGIAAADRVAARQQARETFDDTQEPKTPSAVTGQRRGSQWLSQNQHDAETFAGILRSSGLNAKARETKRIQGRDVYDGWMVNVRDEGQEIGIVAAWHGRRHFVCYVEIAGHAERTEEAARIMLAAMKFAWGQDGTQTDDQG